MDVEFSAPPEITAALRDGRRNGGFIRAYCPVCDPDHRKRGDLTLAAGIVRGRPWWGCHRCHCEKDFKSAQRTTRLRAQLNHGSERERSEFARELIEGSSHVQAGDPVDEYLRKTRYISPVGEFWSSSLRRVRLRHPETKREYVAMLGVVVDASGTAVACHRTFLVEVGGRVVKASDAMVPKALRVRNAKMSLGPVMGHYICFGNGPVVVVAEGIESTLALAMHMQLPAISGLSAAGVKGLVLPKSIRSIYIGPDIGDKQQVGLEAALTLKKRIRLDSRKEGVLRKVDIVAPPSQHNDWADWASANAPL